MYVLTVIHDNPSSGTPVNKHTWVKEFQTIAEVKNYIVEDINDNGNYVSGYSLAKI